MGSTDKKSKKDVKKAKYFKQRTFSGAALGNFGSINNYSLKTKKKEGHRLHQAKNIHH